jgi:hypothetical protein
MRNAGYIFIFVIMYIHLWGWGIEFPQTHQIKKFL